MKMNLLLASLLAFAIVQVNTAVVPGLSGPLHASCKIKWTWSLDCKSVQSAIVDQINKWNTEDNCKNGGEKCLYTLKSQTANSISASHMTPVKHYTDSLEFKFTPSSSGVCEVDGSSSSDTWYAVLDFGTNYCNLNNLITGAALDKIKGYSETTSDSICTQYSTANCTVY